MNLNGRSNIIDSNIKFSLVVPLTQNVPLDTLFESTDKNTELIVVDPNMNSENKQFLESRSGFERIQYVSPHYGYHIFPQGLSNCINSGVLYSKNDWIIITDRVVEFRENFFEVLREDFKCLAEAYQNPYINVILPQSLHEYVKAVKWEDRINSYETRFNTLNDKEYHILEHSNIDVPIICMHKSIFKGINGMDERYDAGTGYHFHNLLYRLMTGGAVVTLDHYLMAYVYALHDLPLVTNTRIYYTAVPSNILLWHYDKYEILHGKILAYNEHDMREDRLANRNSFSMQSKL